LFVFFAIGYADEIVFSEPRSILFLIHFQNPSASLTGVPRSNKLN
jgi:hypothetical protein